MEQRVLVVGDGKHELGDGSEMASLVILLRRLVGDSIRFRPECRQICSFKRRIHARGDRYARKLIAVLIDAQKAGYAAAFIVIDRDGDRSRTVSATEAQESELATIPRAIAVAVETYDAWFLADHSALCHELQVSIDMSPAPETLKSPKAVIEELCNDHHYVNSTRQLYSRLAERIDFDRLRERCPLGFAVFADRVREAGQRLRTTGK